MSSQHEVVEDGFDEVPILSAAGEETDEFDRVAVAADEAVDVNDSEVAATGSGDVEAETMAVFGGKELFEGLPEESFDLAFASELEFGTKLAEEFDDLAFFEVEPFDFIIE